MKTFAIDVDGTIIMMYDKFIDFINSKYNLNIKISEITYYDYLDKNYSGIIKDFTEFWRNPRLYDDIELLYGFKTIIKNLSEIGEIVFVSECFDEHLKSKQRLLERNFSDINYRFLDTRFHDRFQFDILIDDKPKNILEQQKRNKNGLLLKDRFYNKEYPKDIRIAVTDQELWMSSVINNKGFIKSISNF